VQTVCAESGAPASPYCPYTVQKGVVALSAGQYLSQFVGTEYQTVLEDYLALSADNGAAQCPIHGSGQGSGGGSVLPNRQAEDAARIIAAAQQQLAGMDPMSAQYSTIVNAAANLQSLIDAGAPAAEVTAAMTALTQAMMN
jgi:hypothetical protein